MKKLDTKPKLKIKGNYPTPVSSSFSFFFLQKKYASKNLCNINDWKNAKNAIKIKAFINTTKKVSKQWRVIAYTLRKRLFN